MSETGKDERFAEFLKRLALAPAAATASAAISLLGDTLNQVEDEMKIGKQMAECIRRNLILGAKCL